LSRYSHDKTVIYPSPYCNFFLLSLPRKNQSLPASTEITVDNQDNEKYDGTQHENYQMKKFILFKYFQKAQVLPSCPPLRTASPLP
jgi:hypothetical protein